MPLDVKMSEIVVHLEDGGWACPTCDEWRYADDDAEMVYCQMCDKLYPVCKGDCVNVKGEKT